MTIAPAAAGLPDPAIEAVDLVKRYGDVTAVDGVSLRVPRATIFAYLGRNGSGKTTTVRMLTTLSAPSAGSARVAGYDIRDAARVRSRRGTRSTRCWPAAGRCCS